MEMHKNGLGQSGLATPNPSSEEGLRQIISGLQYRRNEALTTGLKVSDVDVTLGLARAALEYDLSDSKLVRKIGDVEQYF